MLSSGLVSALAPLLSSFLLFLSGATVPELKVTLGVLGFGFGCAVGMGISGFRTIGRALSGAWWIERTYVRTWREWLPSVRLVPTDRPPRRDMTALQRTKAGKLGKGEANRRIE